MTQNVSAELAVPGTCHCGEGPLWHPDERCLYWTDIPNSTLFRYDPAADETDSYDTGSPVGGFTIHEDGRLLLFMAGCAVKLWDHGRMQTVIDGLAGEEGNGFNDVIADPAGRVYCGVVATEGRDGRVYRLDPDGGATVAIEGTRLANGMGFSPDLAHMYFSDSGTGEISVFDYDRATGELTNRRIVTKVDESEGVPDGMTVDSEGCLWSARWNGSCLVRMDPSGRVLQTIDLPVRQVSSVTFGGDDLQDIYITSAGGQDTAENGKLAGSIFRLVPGVRGKAEFRSRGHGADCS